MVTRGFFVQGVQTQQFTTPEQVEQLRIKPDRPAGASMVLVAAVDPANPYGAWVSWPNIHGAAFARKSGNFLVYNGAEWVYWLESNVKNIVFLKHGSSEAETGSDDIRILREALRTLLNRYYLKKIVVERWNGMKLTEQPEGQGLLQHIGGEWDHKGMVIWPSALKGS